MAATLSAREGYRLWAPHYADETAVSALEDAEVSALGISLADRRLLDVGCGVGRRLARTDAAFAAGVDLVPDMLRSAPQAVLCAAADARMLPFANSSFDVVWCRLVLGHLREAGAAYGELARVCSPGGIVVVSDLHPAAIAAGHRRTFRDRDGIAHELEHVVHGIDGHRAAASRAGLVFDVERVGVIGPSIEHFYIDAARRDAYVAQRGLPLISVLAWHKRAGAA